MLLWKQRAKQRNEKKKPKQGGGGGLVCGNLGKKPQAIGLGSLCILRLSIVACSTFFEHSYKKTLASVAKSFEYVEHKAHTKLLGCSKYLQYNYIDTKCIKNCLSYCFCSSYALPHNLLHTLRITALNLRGLCENSIF